MVRSSSQAVMKRSNNITSEQEAIKLVMKGQGKNMFGGYKPAGPHQSAYQGTFKGMQCPVTLPLNLHSGNSYATGKIVPDPY